MAAIVIAGALIWSQKKKKNQIVKVTIFDLIDKKAIAMLIQAINCPDLTHRQSKAILQR